MTGSGSHRQGLAGKIACLAVTLLGCTERLGIRMFARSVAQDHCMRKHHHGGCEV